MKQLILSLAIILSASGGMAQDFEGWLCISDKSTGFAFNNGQWDIANFPPGKYILRPAIEDESLLLTGHELGLYQFGLDSAMAGCDYFSESRKTISCDGIYVFRMDTSSRRFLIVYPIGYWIGDNDSASDTPFMEIGTCTQF